MNSNSSACGSNILRAKRPAHDRSMRTMQTLRKFGWLLAVLCACGAPLALAQTTIAGSAQRNLVTESVDTSKRFILADHRVAWAAAQNDRGAVPDSLPMAHLIMTLNRSPDREQAFQQLLKDQQDPSSPVYHHWLTPVEVGAQFGASQHDIDAVSAWLASQGLHVESVSNSRTRIQFSGSASAVGTAFSAPMHYFSVAGETRIANADDPQIPAALASVVSSVNGLHTVKHKPMHRVSAQRGSVSSSKPAGTYCPSSSGTCLYSVFPADFAKIYDLNTVPSSITGSGQTIAILGKARVYSADLQNFQKLSGVTFAIPSDAAGTIIVPTAEGGVDPGAAATTCTDSGTTDTCSNPSDLVAAQSEATLDVERAGSVAPGATIKLIVSADSGSGSNLVDGLNYTLQYAIDDDPKPANILSISFNSCESASVNDASTTRFLDQEFQQAAAEGMSIFVASGDSGAAGCEDSFKTPNSTQTLAIGALCSSGSVTCVGGTQFADTVNPSAYWSSSQGANFLSALGYIPEGAWNEPLDDSSNPTVAATGGGVSAYIATPSWQTGPGVPGTQGRYVPDVSFTSASHDPYFGCMAATGGPCSVGSDGSFTFSAFAGTSASTPSMAGVAALLNQKIGSAQGNLNPRLYALAATSGSGVFHDVTVASSGVSGCTVTVPSLCNNSTAGPTGLTGGLQGYAVGTGYDEATGLGSIDVANLLNKWSSSSSTTFNLDQHGLTGAWFSPATGGQGFVIETYPDLLGSGKGVLAAGWYTFDVTAAGGQRWYTLQGTANQGDTAAVLNIYAATGGNFNAGPALGSPTQVGTATLSFSDCQNATLNFTFTDGSGRSGSIALGRGLANVTCSASGDTGTASDYLLSGAWFNASTSGQGFFFDINPTQTTFFGAWYTFVANGAQVGGGASQRWYTIQDNAFVPGTVSKNGLFIYETTGGVFNSGNVSAGPSVGTANITFQSCSSLTVSYTFTGGTNAGKTGTIDLGRVVGAPAGCSL